MSLQEALKLLRYELGLTQEDLAKKLNKAFVTVNRWENGKGFPSRSNAKSILEMAKKNHASENCITYLNDVLIPDSKRSCTGAEFGFPEIEQDFLLQLVDGAMNALYIIDAKTYTLLYANRTAEKYAVSNLNKSGIEVTSRKLATLKDKRCYHFFGNRNTPCSFCPLSYLNTKSFQNIYVTVPESGMRFISHIEASYFKNRMVYIVYLFDITDLEGERNGQR